MRSTLGGLGPSQTGTRFEAYEAFSSRTGRALLIASLLHGGFLLHAYLRPPPPAPRKSLPIQMEVRTAKRPPASAPKESPPPPLPPPTASHHEVSRSVPREVTPVPHRPEVLDANQDSSAVELPANPASPAETPPSGANKGPIILFPKAVVDPSSVGRRVVMREDTLYKDPLKEVKKEPPFVLVPEKGGGYKSSTRTFYAHIDPDGKVTFEDRTFSFDKGSPGVTVDVGDVFSRLAGIDPYYAEKRKFLAFTEEIRQKLRDKAAQDYQEHSMQTLPEQIAAIWNSRRGAATRRRELYEKWADCADDGDAMARKGRQAVEDFIKGHLPQSSAAAFTEEELEKIARERQGLPPFDPYGSGTP